jgi:hypothetical protein
LFANIIQKKAAQMDVQWGHDNMYAKWGGQRAMLNYSSFWIDD